MTRSTPPRRSRRRQPLTTEIEDLEQRLTSLEHDHQLLRNTLCGLARETNVTVGGVCAECDQAYVLIERGMMYCPKCRTQRAI